MIRSIGSALTILLLTACGGGASSSTDGVATTPDNLSIPPTVAPPATSTEKSSDTVVTQCRSYQGRAEDGVVSFKGLSNAKPPTRALRWQPPQVLSDWE